MPIPGPYSWQGRRRNECDTMSICFIANIPTRLRSDQNRPRPPATGRHRCPAPGEKGEASRPPQLGRPPSLVSELCPRAAVISSESNPRLNLARLNRISLSLDQKRPPTRPADHDAVRTWVSRTYLVPYTMKMTSTAPALVFLVAVAVACAEANNKVKGCGSISALAEGDECSLPWAQLQPALHATQNMLGYAWVMYKHGAKMGSVKSAQKEMDGKVVPVVKRGSVLYCLDHHHLLAALDYAGAPFATAVKPSIYVVCDFSSAPSDAAFWEAMAPHMYNFGRPRASPDSLPTRLPSAGAFPSRIAFNASHGSDFMDDPWRSLAGFIRKLDDAPNCSSFASFSPAANAAGRPPSNHVYGCRGYNKVCDMTGAGTPFFEFRWGYFFNDAHVDTAQAAWRTLPSSAAATWRAAHAALPYPADPQTVSSAPFFAAAAALFPLARSAAAGAFTVPAQLVAIAGALPGHKMGPAPFPTDDPDCSPPSCSR